MMMSRGRGWLVGLMTSAGAVWLASPALAATSNEELSARTRDCRSRVDELFGACVEP
jgi:hypothetical protein